MDSNQSSWNNSDISGLSPVQDQATGFDMGPAGNQTESVGQWFDTGMLNWENPSMPSPMQDFYAQQYPQQVAFSEFGRGQVEYPPVQMAQGVVQGQHEGIPQGLEHISQCSLSSPLNQHHSQETVIPVGPHQSVIPTEGSRFRREPVVKSPRIRANDIKVDCESLLQPA